jgi:hypothetical protein
MEGYAKGTKYGATSPTYPPEKTVSIASRYPAPRTPLIVEDWLPRRCGRDRLPERGHWRQYMDSPHRQRHQRFIASLRRQAHLYRLGQRRFLLPRPRNRRDSMDLSPRPRTPGGDSGDRRHRHGVYRIDGRYDIRAKNAVTLLSYQQKRLASSS